MQATLLNSQIDELAHPLIKIISDFYENPENEKKYQEWKIKQKDCKNNLGENDDRD